MGRHCAAAIVLQTKHFRYGERIDPLSPFGGDVVAVVESPKAGREPVIDIGRLTGRTLSASRLTYNIGGAAVQSVLLHAVEGVRGPLWWALTRDPQRIGRRGYHIAIGFEGWGRPVAAVVPLRQPEAAR